LLDHRLRDIVEAQQGELILDLRHAKHLADREELCVGERVTKEMERVCVVFAYTRVSREVGMWDEQRVVMAVVRSASWRWKESAPCGETMACHDATFEERRHERCAVFLRKNKTDKQRVVQFAVSRVWRGCR
jgi:hypothetical protein